MKKFTGVLEDPRAEEEKQKDWQADEVLLPTASRWDKKPISELKANPIWSQNGSGSCVAMTKARQVSIEIKRKTGEWIDFSPAFIYQRRVNQGEGMWVANANDIVAKQGTTLEALMNSQNLSEDEINLVPETSVAKAIAEGIKIACQSYLYVPADMDKIAQALDKGHGVGILLYADFDEYNEKPEARKKLLYTDAQIKHMVTAVDYFLSEDGERCLWIEDSWGIGHGLGGRRIFTEDFVKERVRLADYFDEFNLDVKIENSYSFKENLQFGQRNDEIKKLQKFLKERGFFPVNQEATGYYGNITAKAVLGWQLDNKVDSEETLKRLDGHYFGPKSRQAI